MLIETLYGLWHQTLHVAPRSAHLMSTDFDMIITLLLGKNHRKIIMMQAITTVLIISGAVFSLILYTVDERT